jgi:SAM-dependent MidA family methyltransferase
VADITAHVDFTAIVEAGCTAGDLLATRRKRPSCSTAD